MRKGVEGGGGRGSGSDSGLLVVQGTSAHFNETLSYTRAAREGKVTVELGK
jgi:hypothetical protein